jgi:hypothetical protein
MADSALSAFLCFRMKSRAHRRADRNGSGGDREVAVGLVRSENTRIVKALARETTKRCWFTPGAAVLVSTSS